MCLLPALGESCVLQFGKGNPGRCFPPGSGGLQLQRTLAGDLRLTVLLRCLLSLARANDSQFPLLIPNVTINLPPSGPEPADAPGAGEEVRAGVTLTAHSRDFGR